MPITSLSPGARASSNVKVLPLSLDTAGLLWASILTVSGRSTKVTFTVLVATSPVFSRPMYQIAGVLIGIDLS